MSDSRTTFLSAADSFVAQVAGIPAGAWGGPGLGEWDLRALVGHTSRSLVTVDTYLDQPAESVAVATAAGYYVAVAEAGGAGGPAIVERGRQAGVALGDDPAGFVRDLATRVAERLPAYDAAYVLTTIAGAMPLDEYLRTRTFELVVHGLDIAAATGVDAAYDLEPTADAATLAAEVAVRRDRGADLLLAATGRRPLDPGFSVV
jgi:uncharacterized protein (TIGR03083 family)